jgi:hypothetical protein
VISPQKRRLNAVRYRRLLESAKHVEEHHRNGGIISYDEKRMEYSIYGESPVKRFYEEWLRDNPPGISSEEFRKLYLGEFK